MIQIRLRDDTLVVGSYLHGECIFNPREGISSKAIKIEVRWRAEGRGNPETHVIYTTEMPLGSQYGNTYRFNCTIPLTGPISYDGELFRIIWEVTASIPKFKLFHQVEQVQVFRVRVREI